MADVIVVFLVWFAVVALLCAVAIARADRWRAPRWAHSLGARLAAYGRGSVATIGRPATGIVVALAGWSVVIIAGWLLGVAAHRLQNAVDWPCFHWWQDHYLTGSWHRVWWTLTNIGSPTVTQILTVAGAVLLAALYYGKPQWWAPPIILLVSYLAEKYSQTILKLVVNRGHPPTTHGTWPSGGMGRLIDVYGLIIYFVILRFWPHSRRAWAYGGSFLALAASVQAYARLNNLEHWTTDVVGGAVYGLLLLLTFVLAHRALMAATIVAPPAPGETAAPAEPDKPKLTV
ncbi:MAG TPA: hypothetical protein VFH38_03705 [Jatrophihabitans sp.]|nr:hypothetical protein [Jatrophihabitans sp.]